MKKNRQKSDVQVTSATDTSESAVAERWLKWCRKHEFVKCVETKVPDEILPEGYRGTLIDVKVFGKRWGPDDKIYSQHEELRQKVARGNCVLELHSVEKVANGPEVITSTQYFFLIFALKKFSGGLGDEDDCETLNMWQKYFIDSISSAKRVVCTTKANGEAAHLSSRQIAGQNYFILGSKNVHLLARNTDDLHHYSDSRFLVARTVAKSFFSDVMEYLEPEKLDDFIQYLQSNRYTAVAEVLQPEYQHIVNLSYLKSPELRFICFTEPYNEDECNSLCPIPPNQAIDKARSFGLKTIDYNIIPADETDEEIARIRGGCGYEGKVLYFLDEADNVLGIIKKKTAWYIILRCIREKASAFTSPKCSLSSAEMRNKVSKRLKEIQNWLSFSDENRLAWTELGCTFVQEMVRLSKTGRNISVRSNFPALWEEFLDLHEKQRTIYNTIALSSYNKFK